MVAEKKNIASKTSVTVCVKLKFDKQTYDIWLTEILETFPQVFWFQKHDHHITVVTTFFFCGFLVFFHLYGILA